MARGACACEPFFLNTNNTNNYFGSRRSKSLENLFKNLSLPMFGGMRYAQKFFRINFKFYKLVFWVAELKIFRKSIGKSFTFFEHELYE